MGSKRDKLKIIYDILIAVREQDGKIKKTHILYKANLSHQMLDEYLNELKKKKFIEEIQINKKRKSYRLLEPGFEYINRYGSIVEFVDTFGFEE